MAHDEKLAARVRELLAARRGITERRMFGGIAFLLRGNMAVVVSGQGGLMLRVEAAETEALLAKPHAGPMFMRGRALAGWLRVAPEGVRTKRQLEVWVARGTACAAALPAKS